MASSKKSGSGSRADREYKSLVGVSQLADYASDPTGFIERLPEGGVRNAKAARAGTRGHDQLGKSGVDSGIVWIAGAVIAAIVMFALAGVGQ